MDYVISTTIYLLKGTYTTLCLYIVTVLFSLPLSMLFAALQFSSPKFVKYIFDIYAWIFRGTPLILQLIFFYYGLPLMTNNAIAFPAFTSAAITFVLNYSAYLMEIFRAGIESIEKGQYEASKVLGFSKAHTFFYIVLPQVIKRILPSLGNEVVTLVKDTALAQTIGVSELFRVAQNAASRMFSTMPIFIAGVFYFVMNYIVSKLFDFFEKKLNYYR